MGKQKQQIISRFFAPKPSKPTDSSQPSSSSLPTTQTPKITATVTFSPSKRSLSQTTTTPQQPKKPKLSPQTQRPHVTKYTPLEQQVIELKNKYKDVILMVEVGYRYRFFGDDAEIASRVLGIYAHFDHNFLTASVPTFRLSVHVTRLVSEGYKVGVVKQTETAAIKKAYGGESKDGLFCRGLSGLYTKATLKAADFGGGGGGVVVEDNDRCAGESSYLVCVVEEEMKDKKKKEKGLDSLVGAVDTKVGVVGVEVSTGDVVYGEFEDGLLRSGLEAVVLSLSPVELVFGEPLSRQTEKLLLTYAGPASNVRVELASRECFNNGGALSEVMSLYENMIEDSSPLQESEVLEAVEHGDHHSAIEGIMKMPDLAVQALALTIQHLKQYGFERILCLGASFRPLSSNPEMTLSANTLQQLEIIKNSSDGSVAGSLLQSMNHTLTIYGSRLLKHWVTHPLRDKNMISARLDAVSEIAESLGSLQNFGGLDAEYSDVIQSELGCLLSSVLTTLARSSDLQRGIMRIFHGTSTASEFIAVMEAILYAGKQLQQLNVEKNGNDEEGGVHSALLRKLILTASSSSVISNAAKLLSMLNREAADLKDLRNLMVSSEGQFPEVTKARKAVQLANEKLDSLISVYRKQLRMHKLEFTSVSGVTHLIELPLEVKVPINWVKVNSTKKTIRYHPPEILTALDQLSLANEELSTVCRAAWDNFLRGFNKYCSEFQTAVQALAALDCLHSLAILSRTKNYVRPVFQDEDHPVQIQISSGRHPVLETILEDSFVPNDTNLQADKEFCQIITGPNMGGKSCYIRQVALLAIMAQVGSFVPASSAKLYVLDGIYTRIGASDSIQQGRSTFFEELSEASHILMNCTARSLVIIDELGRGTSTHDGVAIAYATLHHLLEHKKCMVLFVTHYPKIAEIRYAFPGSVGVYHVSYLTSGENTLLRSSSHCEDVTYLYKLVPGVCGSSFGLKVAQLAQLPSSCISRASVMAAKLEMEISNRLLRKRLRKTKKLEYSQVHDNLCTGQKDSSQKTISYAEFFYKLRLALLDDDLADRLKFLKQAREIAESIMSR